jgi:hypothetical protein
LFGVTYLGGSVWLHGWEFDWMVVLAALWLITGGLSFRRLARLRRAEERNAALLGSSSGPA